MSTMPRPMLNVFQRLSLVEVASHTNFAMEPATRCPDRPARARAFQQRALQVLRCRP